jgi:hypothetical protein
VVLRREDVRGNVVLRKEVRGKVVLLPQNHTLPLTSFLRTTLPLTSSFLRTTLPLMSSFLRVRGKVVLRKEVRGKVVLRKEEVRGKVVEEGGG